MDLPIKERVRLLSVLFSRYHGIDLSLIDITSLLIQSPIHLCGLLSLWYIILGLCVEINIVHDQVERAIVWIRFVSSWVQLRFN